jgi:hypothetical protein
MGTDDGTPEAARVRQQVHVLPAQPERLADA